MGPPTVALNSRALDEPGVSFITEFIMYSSAQTKPSLTAPIAARPMRDDVRPISTAMDSSHEARTDGDCGDGWGGRLIVSRPGTVEALD